MMVNAERRVDLLHDPVPHHHDPVAHGHRLDLVVRHVDHRCLQLMVEPRDLGAHLDAEICVEVAQRLIKQEHLRLPDDRPPEGDALALAAGKRLGFPVEVGRNAEYLRGMLDPFVDLRLVVFPELEPESEVVVDGHVGVECVVLKDHRDIAVLRGDVVDHLPVDADCAGRNLFQSGDHPEHGGFSATGRADKDDEFLVPDHSVHFPDGGDFSVVHLGHMFKLDFSHGSLPSVVGLGYRGSNLENIGTPFFKHNQSSQMSLSMEALHRILARNCQKNT